jgi:hypothetical protein
MRLDPESKIEAPSHAARRSVAVVTPIYRETLSSEERMSLSHMRQHLRAYPCYLMTPRHLRPRLPNCEVRDFDDECFLSVQTYSKLLLSRDFYRTFLDFEYILIYQLDCLVFQDELQWWCEQGYDYIGAPLFCVKGDLKSGFSGACNGGLSLRRVRSFLQVLESPRYVAERVSFLADVFRRPFVEVRPMTWMKRLKKRVQVAREVRQGVDKYVAGYSLNCDQFWSSRAAYFHPSFRVAPPEVALSFAFEAAPRFCFERNGGKLPFGAHAWQKYDRAFWEPYLISETPATPQSP